MIKGFSTILRSVPACLLALSLSPSLFAQTAPATAPSQPQNATTAPPQSAPAGTAQPAVTPSASGQSDQQYTITRQVNEVDLVFTVTDKHGHFIKDLKQSDFALLDDQKAPDRVYSFTQQTNLPLRLGILIDTSTSIRTRFQFEQQAATEFLLQIVKPQSDKAFV
jgi:Ca-activated chloride channel family protein